MELLSWLRWFKRWHDGCQYHLYSWTRIVIQKLSHIFDCVSLALAVLGTEILYLYIYMFNLECFDIHWKKKQLKHHQDHWIILDHRSFKFCDVGKITPINKSFAGWLILGEASSWTDPLRSLPSGMGSLTCFFFNMFRWLCKLQSLNSMTSEVTKRLEKSDTSLRGELTWNYDTFCIFLYFPDAP